MRKLKKQPLSGIGPKLIQYLKRDKAFIRGEDGQLLFFPAYNGGGFTAFNLRQVADYLDEQNEGGPV